MKVDQLISQWFWRAYSLSFKIPSELSVLEEFTWERWRISANIPSELLNYSKVQFNKPILIFISVLFLILLISFGFYFQNNDHLYFIYIFLLIIYLFLMKFFLNQTRPNQQQLNINLPKLYFNDSN